MSGLVVSLDGPGSSGKSSVGMAAAARLGYRFLDTGVLYRAVAWLAVEEGIDVEDEVALVAVVPRIQLVTDEEGRMRRVRIDGVDITEQLHASAVDRHVSGVARQPKVRESLLPVQRALAAGGGIIVAGRDIGSVVLPDAGLKLWLEVSLEERARRRARERGLAPDSAEAAAILDDLRARDHVDRTREVAPLRVPEGATVVRSDGRDFEQTVDEVSRLIQERAGHPEPARG